MDPAALGGLYRLHAPALRLFARSWADRADDVVHDAFLRLARQHPWPENPVAWLYQVVRNRCRELARQEERRQRHETRARPSAYWFSTADELIDGRVATECLSALDDDEREVIIARIWGGLTLEEISDLVGSSIATVHRRYQSGLTRLRAKLETRCELTSPKD
jgi:RNA polymerase sigma-70 factor (ECF subfamily)